VGYPGGQCRGVLPHGRIDRDHGAYLVAVGGNARAVDTTFSTFSLDVATLYERGATLQLATYIVASVAVSILALFAGLRLMRLVLV
jgi:fluoride ion exporter CrcB/FEX